MGLHDRPYWRGEQGGDYGAGGAGRGLTVGMPKPGKVVKYLLIINIAVFLLQVISQAAFGLDLGLLFGAMLGGWWQVWRYVTFQFLHSQYSLWHLGLNMLGLYMLGSPLEMQWGSKQFLKFYLVCGLTAGVAFVIMAAVMALPADIPLIGASGGVYGIVLACAVLFPHFRLIFFLFPVPIRLAAVIIFGGMILVIFSSLGSQQRSPRFWSDVAHLGGAVAAAVWIWVLPRLRGVTSQSRAKLNQGAWERKMAKRRQEQAELDRILEKIRRNGINSITRKERQKLQEATRRQSQEDRELYR